LLISTVTVSQCCLIKLLPYILSEKDVYILASEMVSTGNRHCANCIGTLSFPMLRQWYWSVVITATTEDYDGQHSAAATVEVTTK